MAIPSKQIGGSVNYNLLWQISKQLERLIEVRSNVTTSTSSSTTTTTTTTAPCVDCVASDVIIGTQTWAKCNLNVSTYANGDPIPEVTDPNAWINLTTGAWCYWNNDPSTEATYGRLYNWYAVNDARGLAPATYHVPSDVEVATLISFLGGTFVAGGAMKEEGSCHWNSPNIATNSSGFTGISSGFRWSNNGGFFGKGPSNNWWTSTDYGSDGGRYSLTASNEDATQSTINKTNGFSVRLIKD